MEMMATFGEGAGVGVGSGVGLEELEDPQAQRPKATSPHAGPRRRRDRIKNILARSQRVRQGLFCQSGRAQAFDALDGSLSRSLSGVDLRLWSGEVQAAVSPEE